MAVGEHWLLYTHSHEDKKEDNASDSIIGLVKSADHCKYHSKYI
jgi:hypothetical protein